jgi:TolA-binding protein
MTDDLIADAREAGLTAGCTNGYNDLSRFDEIRRKRHEHTRTDNGAVITKLQADLDNANAKIERLTEALVDIQLKNLEKLTERTSAKAQGE